MEDSYFPRHSLRSGIDSEDQSPKQRKRCDINLSRTARPLVFATDVPTRITATKYSEPIRTTAGVCAGSPRGKPERQGPAHPQESSCGWATNSPMRSTAPGNAVKIRRASFEDSKRQVIQLPSNYSYGNDWWTFVKNVLYGTKARPNPVVSPTISEGSLCRGLSSLHQIVAKFLSKRPASYPLMGFAQTVV